MILTAHTLFLLLGAVCFGLGAFNVPRLNWTSAGFCFVTLSFLIA